jgi:MoaA/NifB/PqqE/SkfB family radical SAM enzyme
VALELSILYRGPLSSCNYACGYCPFAKRRERARALMADRTALERFLCWVASRRADTISVLFTPWGEALIRRWYQIALERLSRLPNVNRAAIQTNLSSRLEWVGRCDPARLAIWATYHPAEVDRATFLSRCHELSRRGIRFSVGIVGLKEHFVEIDAMRRELPDDVYLWINAFKRQPDYYSEEARHFLGTIDPLFSMNNVRHSSIGRACRTGSSVISVDGEGTIRRCHFVPETLGNIYEPGFEQNLFRRACPAQTCSCHIGYVHLDHLGLAEVFGRGILERIPEHPIWKR